MANEDWEHLAVDWAKRQIEDLKASRDALLAAFGDISKLDTEGSLVDWLRVLEANVGSVVGRIERLERDLDRQRRNYDNLNWRVGQDKKTQETKTHNIETRILELEEKWGGVDIELTTLRQWLKDSVQGMAARIEPLEKKIEWIQTATAEADSALNDRVGRLEEELEGTDRSVSAHHDRLAALEVRLTAYGVPLQGSFKIPPLKESGKEFQFYQPPTDEERHLDEFSPPIGGRLFHAPTEPQIVSSLRTGGPRYQEWRRRSAESAHWAGEARKAALQGAAIRVNDYLTKGQFSEETIKEVLAAVWGAEGPSGEGAVE